MEEIYREYLRWFGERAREGAVPRRMEELCHMFLFSQTLFMGPLFVLDQAFWITWIAPEDAKSRRAEWFLFTEIDTLPRETNGDVLPSVKEEYRRITEL